MVFCKVRGRMELYDPDDFFREANELILTRPDRNPTGQDEVTFFHGVTQGRVLFPFSKRYREISRWLFDQLVAGNFSPRRDHSINGPIDSDLLEDFFAAIGFNHQNIWVECREVHGSKTKNFVIRVMLIKYPWITRKLRLRPYIASEATVLISDIKKINGSAHKLEVFLDDFVLVISGRGVRWENCFTDDVEFLNQ